MARAFKPIVWVLLLVCILGALGFLWSSGSLTTFSRSAFSRAADTFDALVAYHCTMLGRDARHYYLLSQDMYAHVPSVRDMPAAAVITIAAKALFNALFQPFFLCAFTPQVILAVALFPFFIFGTIRYGKKIPLAIGIFFGVALYTALHGSVVEALVRHRMACELIYYLVGTAGLTGWITKD